MLALLNPRIWFALAIVAALAFSHVMAYRKGAGNVRIEWQAAISAANSEARSLEQARQRRADDAGRLAAAREAGNRTAAADARAERDGLRGDLNAIERASKESHDAAAKSVAALSAVFESCTRRYLDVAEEAAGHASDSLTYQQSWPR